MIFEFPAEYLSLPSNFVTLKRDPEYVINYQGLSNGTHTYEFRIGESFFENLEEEEFRKPDIEVKAELVRDPSMLVFRIDHQGTVELTCDRCLDDFTCRTEGHNKLIVKFSDSETIDNELIVILPHGAYEIDLAPYIREYILLSLPWKRTCDQSFTPKECNREMLRKIDTLQGENEKKENEADPRWDALKNIKPE